MKILLALICLAISTTAESAEDHPGARVEVLAKSSNSWNGSALPGYGGGTPEVSILRITIPAGATLPMHRHPVINAGVLLEGELMVISEAGDTLHLSAGESIVELVDQWHYGRNEGDTDAVIIVFYAGFAGEPVTEAK